VLVGDLLRDVLGDVLGDVQRKARRGTSDLLGEGLGLVNVLEDVWRSVRRRKYSSELGDELFGDVQRSARY
jgi:hypothetical protein